MFTRLAIALSTVAAASLVAVAPSSSADEGAASDPTATYIVQFTPGSDRSAEVAKAKGLGMKVTFEYANVFSGMAAVANPGQLRALQSNPNVRLVEADQVVTIDATQSGPTWGLNRTDQRSLPLDSTYTYPDSSGLGVTAYVIDTGVLGSHNEFGSRVRSGYTAISDGRGTTDCNGHGTHVAGTVGGSTYGMAKSVSLVAVRVLGCDGSGTTSGVIAGMDWTVGDHVSGPAVANMSLGGGASQATDDAVARMVADGISVSVAAGNSNADACTSSPARAASAITVGATTSADARSSFSNFGSCLDIFAPGSEITSAWSTSNSATSTISGTSMASPHVAGAAALFLAVNPTASPATVTAALTADATANKVTSPGTGSPNRLLFVGVSTPPTPAVAPTIASFTPLAGFPGSSVTLAGTGLSGATAKVNEVSAAVTASSDTSLTLTVPSTATSGPITVTNSVGSATSANFSVSVATVPAAPTTVAATSPSNGRATVRWTLSSSNGGSAITGQTVVAYRISGTPQRTTYNVSATATAVTLSLTRRAQYQFTVTANNAVGSSTESTRSGTITIR